jgi:enamine deaminase RidA (YjgF/YER057c/UK114 family)
MGVTSRIIAHEGFTQYYITGEPTGGADNRESVAELYSEIGIILLAYGIALLQEKIYALTGLKSDVIAARAAALRASGCDPDTPYSFVEGAPVTGTGFAGVQIWGVSYPQDSRHSITTIASGPHGKGRIWESERFSLLCLPPLKKACPAGGADRDRRFLAGKMFEHTDSQLAEFGFDFVHVIRTWFYLPQLLDWYAEFNNARSDFFRVKGIGDHGSGGFLPASTCVQGRCDDEECAMELIAVRVEDGSTVAVSPVRRTGRQDDALAYGSSFSRAVCLDLIGNTVIFCSGTASINRYGATVGANDPVRQCEETLDNIEALLCEHGGDLNDVVSATLFCKNGSVEAAWKHLAGRKLPAGFPTIIVRADICREELIVELEVTAVVSHAKDGSKSEVIRR